MLRGKFRAIEDVRMLDELKGFPPFKHYLGKLQQAHAEATRDLAYAAPADLQTQQGYVRCLHELIEELTK